MNGFARIGAPSARMRGGNSTRTVVLVHGAGGGGWEWRLWGDVLSAQGFDVLAPDLRPVAEGLENTGFDDYHQQVVEWCRAARTPCVLAGASLGGLLALDAAATVAPSALILINPVPPAGITPRLPLPRRSDRVRWSTSELDDTRAALPDAGLASVRWVHQRWRDESGTALNEAADGITVTPPMCPVLVLAAADDATIPAAATRDVAQHLGTDFALIPGCGHLGILVGQRAATAAKLAATWLASAIGNSR